MPGERDAAAAVAISRPQPEIPRRFQEPDYPRHAADRGHQGDQREIPEHPQGHGVGKLHAAQHAVAERLRLLQQDRAKSRSQSAAQHRFRQAARHELRAGSRVSGEFHARDLQPGIGAAGLVELHGLSRQRGKLSAASAECAA